MKYKVKQLLAIIAFVVSLTACGSISSKTEAVVDKRIPAGIYVIGDYIQPGKYIMSGQIGTRLNEVMVFESEENYKNYMAGGSYTWKEASEAFGMYGFFTVYLDEADGMYIDLKPGYVLWTEEEVLLNSYDIEAAINANEVVEFDAGIMLVGEDVPSGQYELVAAMVEYDINMLVFESLDVYKEFYKADRYTIGEELDAEKRYAHAVEHMSKGESFSVYLKEGNVLTVEDGRLKFVKLQ